MIGISMFGRSAWIKRCPICGDNKTHARRKSKMCITCAQKYGTYKRAVKKAKQ